MDKSEFSERLFETLVNHEILKQLKCDIYIPSQTNKAHLGLDALFQEKKKFLHYNIKQLINIREHLLIKIFNFLL